MAAPSTTQPGLVSAPTKPFTSCDSGVEEVAKLPHVGLNPTSIGFDSLTRAALSWYQGTRVSPSMVNAVVPYVYGRCAFADMATALATATSAAHRIYLLGWWVDLDTVLLDGTPPLLLRDCLANTKAAIRGMFWKSPNNNPNNEAINSFLNKLPNGAAILDSRLPFLRLRSSQIGIRGGVHHQKLLVVSGFLGLIAFTGGMDINKSRITVSAGQGWPYHDAQVRITGPAAGDLLNVFQERWLDHPASKELDQTKFGMIPTATQLDFSAIKVKPSKEPPPTCTHRPNRAINTGHAVGIGRTYANLRKFNSIDTTESYSFASNGEESAWRLIEKGISSARRYIYIEDQYFVSRRLKTVLLSKLRDPQFQFLLVLMESSPTFEWNKEEFIANEVPYLIAARNEIRADFAAVDPRRLKWRMFSLKPSPDPQRQQWCGSYVHSKIQIYDDECAIIGSANADDRGYTFDSEIVACVTDAPLGRAGGQHFARDLRVMLWHKHLAVAETALGDWATGLRSWITPPSGAMIVDNSELEDSPLLGPKPILRNFKEADRQWRETIDPDADLLP